MNPFSASRRRFLKQASNAGMACSATALFGRPLLSPPGGRQSASSASGSAPTLVYVDSRRTIAPIDRNLFGSFLEHLGRAIYEGIYDLGSKLSDANGFRKDVLAEIRQLAFRSFAIREEILFPAITGSMALVPRRNGRGCLTRLGTRWNRTSSEPTSSLPGARLQALSL